MQNFHTIKFYPNEETWIRYFAFFAIPPIHSLVSSNAQFGCRVYIGRVYMHSIHDGMYVSDGTEKEGESCVASLGMHCLMNKKTFTKGFLFFFSFFSRLGLWQE